MPRARPDPVLCVYVCCCWALPCVFVVFPQVVGPYDFFQSPISDVCQRPVSCKFEEDLTQNDVNPRWFEATESTTIFEIIRRLTMTTTSREGSCAYLPSPTQTRKPTH